VYWAIEKVLSLHGYRSLITSITGEMEENLTFPEVLFEQQLIGVIVVGVLKKEYIHLLVNSYNNFVQVDNYFMDLAINSVATANVEGGYEATKFLIEQGCSRIGFVGHTNKYNSYKDRCRGYTLALSDASIQFEPSRVLTNGTFFRPEVNLEAILEVIIYEKLDALFCASDRLAIQIIGILHKKRIKIPQDISIIGFDDTENSDIVNPPLTTMRVPRGELGYAAAHLLVEKIKSKKKPPSAISIYPRLIKRKSVKMDTTIP
jgi:DNA-binding LacI/PurR family transcriptional regulator